MEQLKDITERAILVSVKISQWGGSRKDVDATMAIATAMGNNQEDARVIKDLIPRKHRQGIKTAEGKVRQVVHYYTLPWTDDGFRVLPCEMYGDFHMKFMEAKMDWDKAVQEFVEEIPAIYAEAPKRLGKMFKANEMPSQQEVARKFQCMLRHKPIPKGEDYRITMSEQVMSTIRQEAEDAVVQASKNATLNCYLRLQGVIEQLIDGLERQGVKKDGGKRAQFFKRSTVDAVTNLVCIMDGLNVNDDPELTQIISEVRDMTIWTTEMIKDDDRLRDRLVRDAKNIKDKVAKHTEGATEFFGVGT